MRIIKFIIDLFYYGILLSTAVQAFIIVVLVGSNALTEEPDGLSTTTAYIITFISFLIAMLIFRWLLNLLRKFVYYIFGLDSTFRNTYTAENKSTDDF